MANKPLFPRITFDHFGWACSCGESGKATRKMPAMLGATMHMAGHETARHQAA